MRTTEKQKQVADNRPLEDAELDHVNGGVGGHGQIGAQNSAHIPQTGPSNVG